jgi:Family of unknown function (DUF5681)
MAEKGPKDPVGYKRPPRATRFRPGQSGNPNGRPKGARNFATALEQELRSRVAVNENGRRKKISKREAIAKQLVNKAASGDPRAIPIVLNEMRLQESQGGIAGGPSSTLPSPADQQVMASIIARIRSAETLPAAAPEEPGSQDSEPGRAPAKEASS